MALESGNKVAVSCCPRCQSERVWKDEIRKTQLENIRRYICRSCGFRFSEPSKRKVEFNVTREFLEGSHADDDLPHDVLAGPGLPLKKAHDDLENKMRITLNRLGLGQWSARWLPDSSKRIRGKADPETMSIEEYDLNKRHYIPILSIYPFGAKPSSCPSKGIWTGKGRGSSDYLLSRRYRDER